MIQRLELWRVGAVGDPQEPSPVPIQGGKGPRAGPTCPSGGWSGAVPVEFHEVVAGGEQLLLIG